MNIFSRKIAVKLLLAIVVAYGAALVTTIVEWSLYMAPLYLQLAGADDPMAAISHYNLLSFVFFGISVSVFILVFLLLISKRLKYLNYISTKIVAITEVAYIEPLQIKGRDELALLAQNINIMSERIKDEIMKTSEVQQSKHELISAVSHDLKSPLTSIIGYLELTNKSDLSPENQGYIEIAYRKSLNVKHLVNELLEFVKLSDPNFVLNLTPTDLNVLLKQSLGDYLINFQEKNMLLDYEGVENAVTLSDKEKILRVFDNIINNALKYGDDNSSFRVRISADEHINITFTNWASNFNPNNLDRIFDWLYREDKSRSYNPDGSGLGLASAKKIIELHCGTIEAEYNDNCFTIRIMLTYQ